MYNTNGGGDNRCTPVNGFMSLQQFSHPMWFIVYAIKGTNHIAMP